MTNTTPIQNFVDFEKLCRDRVIQDNKDFGITSFYVPNPRIAKHANWCLIAMEPSLSGLSPEEFQSQLNLGFLNFLWSEGDFILHYCAFTYLCREVFDYHVTDISKGAMATAVANTRRRERYDNWLIILKHELRLLDNPNLIAIGSRSSNFLRRKNFSLKRSVRHYSQNNAIIICNIQTNLFPMPFTPSSGALPQTS